MRAEGFRTEGFKEHPLNTDWDWKRLKANYYGLVTMVDNAVGRILDALEASGQLTIPLLRSPPTMERCLENIPSSKRGSCMKER